MRDPPERFYLRHIKEGHIHLDRKEAVAIYGLMFRIESKHPELLDENLWWGPNSNTTTTQGPIVSSPKTPDTGNALLKHLPLPRDAKLTKSPIQPIGISYVF